MSSNAPSALLGEPKQRRHNDTRPTVFCGLKHFVENAAGKASIVAPAVGAFMSALTSLRRAPLKLPYSFV
ncbi:MAG TPA: hypothetical protein VK818_03310 [Methylomirabilota bacterium]|nr:hypothetical protein [Methylomirabilota bacterium]